MAGPPVIIINGEQGAQGGSPGHRPPRRRKNRADKRADSAKKKKDDEKKKKKELTIRWMWATSIIWVPLAGLVASASIQGLGQTLIKVTEGALYLMKLIVGKN